MVRHGFLLSVMFPLLVYALIPSVWSKNVQGLPQCPTCHITKCYAGNMDPLVMVPIYCILKSSLRLKSPQMPT